MMMATYKNPIYCVVVGTDNAGRTSCASAPVRHHHALYVDLFVRSHLLLGFDFFPAIPNMVVMDEIA
jgi:hypothetical protein